jgi:hypothetical protein
MIDAASCAVLQSRELWDKCLEVEMRPLFRMGLDSLEEKAPGNIFGGFEYK